jgi:hypothetical protein
MVHDWNPKRLSLHGVLCGLVEGALGQTDGAGCDWRSSLKNKKQKKSKITGMTFVEMRKVCF